MKKLTLVVAMFAFLAIVVNSYAEVQQVRLSGELRLRGYWAKNLNDGMGTHDQKEPSDVCFAQRTRLTVEADLEDKVLVVATLQAYGAWGRDTKGTPFNYDVVGLNYAPISRKASPVGLVEGYVRLSELFWSPLSLQLGRQNLNFGSGLIFSANDKEWAFDGAVASVDMADCGYRFDLVASKLMEADILGSAEENHHRDADVYFLNFAFEPKSDSLKWLSKFEAYAGYLAGGNKWGRYQEVKNQFEDGYVWIFGLRGDMKFMDDKMKVWGEVAYERGQVEWDGGVDQRGWLLDLGASFGFKDVAWTPVLSAGYTYASGTKDTDTKEKAFAPWFDYASRGGFVVKPFLSNIHIFTLGLDTNPSEKWMLGVHGYMYRQAQKCDSWIGNPFVDNGGIVREANGLSKKIGYEVDFVLGYNYSKDVKTNLMFGWFNPGNAMDCSCGSKAKDVLEVRGEMLVNF